jgi:hypothetical protein
MKKILMALVVAGLIGSVFASSSEAAQKYQKSDTTALLMSVFAPGAGEWYNSDFNGNFPLGECVVGQICFCFKISSIIDATAGDATNGKMRIDFWSGASVE